MADASIARVGDPGSHGGAITTGTPLAIINDRLMARVGDIYACPVHGPNPIITGVYCVIGQDHHVAHVGSKTACGATIIAGSPDTFVDDIYSCGSAANFVMGASFGGAPKPVVKTADEICEKLAEVLADENIIKKIEEANRPTRETGWEYGGWIVETSPGKYDIEIITSKSEWQLYFPDAPENTVGDFHTHPQSRDSEFSDHDIKHAPERPGMFEILSVIEDRYPGVSGLMFMNKKSEYVYCDGANGPVAEPPDRPY